MCVLKRNPILYKERLWPLLVFTVPFPPTPPLLLDVVPGDPCNAANLLLWVYCLRLIPLCSGFCFVLGLWFSNTFFLVLQFEVGIPFGMRIHVGFMECQFYFRVTVTLTSGLSSRKILKYCVASSFNTFPQMCCMLRVAFVMWLRRMTLFNPLYSDKFSHTDKAIWAATYFQQYCILTSVE